MARIADGSGPPPGGAAAAGTQASVRSSGAPGSKPWAPRPLRTLTGCEEAAHEDQGEQEGRAAFHPSGWLAACSPTHCNTIAKQLKLSLDAGGRGGEPKCGLGWLAHTAARAQRAQRQGRRQEQLILECTLTLAFSFACEILADHQRSE